MYRTLEGVAADERQIIRVHGCPLCNPSSPGDRDPGPSLYEADRTRTGFPQSVATPSQAIPIQRQTALTGLDLDHLGEMQLDAIGVGSQELVGQVNHQQVHHEFTTRFATCDKCPGATCETSGEIVANNRSAIGCDRLTEGRRSQS